MRCFVIHLERDRARREAIVPRLGALGLDFELFPAVDGRGLAPEQLQRDYDPAAAARIKREMTPGEIGCALSHQGVYRRIVADDLPFALVLEDDARVGDDIGTVLAALEPLLRSEAPRVVLLNCVKRTSYLATRRLVGRYQLAPVLDGTWGAHGYVLNRAAAQSLLKQLHPVRLPADIWDEFRHRGWVQVRAVVPYVVGLSELAKASNLQADRLPRERETLRAEAAGWRYRLRRYGYDKFLYQLAVRPFERRQSMTW